MEEYVEDLIATKINLAQSEERSLHKDRQIKILQELTDKLQAEIMKLSNENTSLMASISQLIEEKNTLRLQLEEANSYKAAANDSPEGEDYRSPDQFLEIPYSEDRLEVWNQILSTGILFKSSKKLRMLTRKGIPNKLRGECWRLGLGNPLLITPALYNILLEKVAVSSVETKEANGSSLIPMDLRRTLNNYNVFQQEQPLHTDLAQVLEVFAVILNTDI
jgi:regulator of replication initiation timing